MVRIPSLSRRTEPAGDPAQTTGGRTGVLDRRPDRTEPMDRVPTPEPGPAPEPEPVAPAGPRPRGSVLATLGLVAGVTAALLVLSGTLAGYGVAVGVLALLFAIGGISATGHRHVAGKSDALLGLLLGLAAVVLGIIALTGAFAWPSMDGDAVARFREWLDSQSIDRF